MNIFSKLKSLIALAFVSISLMFASAAAAKDAVEDGIVTGFGKITSIQDVAIPLLIGIVAVSVAAFFAMRMLGRAK
ncbi:hypothetical protein L6Q21_13090 [Sandaracinobacter sp. RS1-74]|uniref:hypothetical protein n=1 Tax=Sandaracinobacteroides sayramensis TaxID=2913411 RepID=UPI001EDAABF5|nr:hypothetical protein [Sandaracinobacteroides sayramensis]MCG2841918.1 hypothetical protein [Sandaracinobacteroides sayramensis]